MIKVTSAKHKITFHVFRANVSGRESERASVRECVQHSRDGCSRLGFWQRSLPYPPIYFCVRFLFLLKLVITPRASPWGGSYKDSFLVSQNFSPSSLCTPLALPQGSPLPQSQSLTVLSRPPGRPGLSLGVSLAEACPGSIL